MVLLVVVVVVVRWDYVWPLGAVVVVVQRPLLGSLQTQLLAAHPALLVILETRVQQGPVPIPAHREIPALLVPTETSVQQEILVPGPRVAILAPPAMQHQREPMGTSVPQEIPDRPVPRETPRFSIRILSLLVVQRATLVQRALVARLVLVARQATLATPAA